MENSENGCTTFGGGPREFPQTRWSLVAGLQATDPELRQRKLHELCTLYWKPVCLYIRGAWSKSIDDAKDLSQGFFCALLKDSALERYRPDRGGFRRYLKSVLRHFAADKHDEETALKRGGGKTLVPMDGDEKSLKELLPDGRAKTPEEAFDTAWTREIIRRAVDCVRAEFTAQGKADHFRLFELYDLGEGGEPLTYAKMGERLGMKESDVRNHLFGVRERVRAQIRTEISETVTDPEELEAEWSALFG